MVFEAFINSLVQVYIDSKAFGSTNLHDRSALHCAVLGGGVVKYLACFHATTASSRSPATTIRPTPFPRSSSLRAPLHALTRTVALSQELYDLLATTVPLKDFPYNRVGLDVNDEGGHGRSSTTRRSARRSSAPGCCSRTTSAATTRTVPSSQTSSTGRLRQTALQRERGDGPCDVLHADDGLIGIRNIASVSSFIFCVDGFNHVKIDSSKMVILMTLSYHFAP